MFGESLFESSGTKKPTKQWMTLPASLIGHGLLIIAVIIVPLMNADSNLPEVKVFNVFMTSAPPPPPPPPPPAAKKKTKSKADK
ncbi:MAG: hypothetical protein KAS21_07315, partial [Candidatus Aminicenantes bacterium]|nr:hypothetical protein [Candidatus Aminicenantes bacterium]